MDAIIYLELGINWNSIEVIDLTGNILASERYHKWKHKNAKAKCIKRVINNLDKKYVIINRDITIL